MKALGKDIWDFYLNGWPEGYYHDEFEIEIGYIPCGNALDKAHPLIDLDKEYELGDLGLVIPEKDADYNNNISFEDSYLAWKGMEKPKPLTFEGWFDTKFVEPSGIGMYSKDDLALAWNAAIESVGGE